MEINPSLLAGVVLAYADAQLELSAADKRYSQLRIYPAGSGAGFFFLKLQAPARWYWMDGPGADHFRAVQLEDVTAALAAGAKVQLVGDHARSLALWRSWAECAKDTGV